ncbi:prefoldin subunit alpha [Candidatus Methanomassiliicoccus intestinalis]|uniref:prefoldin subunit alpha n=1 Tax=Candidatus Methanomassiliicoccus intestinalis TaxID=1406512 RepID=UPI0037DCD7E0
MNEQELRQAMSTLELYRTQLASIAENQQLIQVSIEELARARETFTQYKDAEPGSELLIPVGGSSFVFAKVEINDKAIVGLGTGVSMEKPIDEAISLMEERANELMESLKKLIDRRMDIEGKAEELTYIVQQEISAMNGQQ